MPRPTRRRPGSPWYFRTRVPADVQSLIGRPEISYSLRTTKEGEAIRLHAEHLARHLAHWQALRDGPKALTAREISGLAGAWYSEWVGGLTEEPGEPGVWAAVQGALDRTRSDDPAALEHHFGSIADDLLAKHGLVTDAHSRVRLLAGLQRALQQAADTLSRRADGDYGPDAHAGNFAALPAPANAPPSAPAENTGGPSLWDLFGGWEKEHRRNGRSEDTARDFRSKVQALVTFLGHDTAAKVTAGDVVRWKDDLLESGLSARTVADKYMVAVRNLFRFAKANALSLSDPTEHISVRYRVAPKTREQSFTEGEAKAILAAARAEKGMTRRHAVHTRNAIRWVPWVCAFTGARVTEITQLRKEDVEDVSGIPCIRITPVAGSVKTGEYRRVPVHPQLVREGFLKFVEGQPTGPLFRDGGTAGNMSKRVCDWVRDAAGITDTRLQPNHAWRHRFKTLCRHHGVPGDLADHMQGHASSRAADGYGEFTVKALHREVLKLPDVEV